MGSGDVAIIPAFGVPTKDQAALQERGCIVVDATCGSVVNVWRRVESYAKDQFTAIIHGKYWHEETIATASRVTQYPAGKCLIVLDKPQARVVCDYIVRGGSRAAFLQTFAGAISEGFDPERDLVRVGVANQTTMLSSESLEIGEMLRAAMAARYGAASAGDHFRSFDTICSATQERQDAIIALAQDPTIDLFLIVGGFKSSNTAHLCEIASQSQPAYHIEGARGIVSLEEIEHKPVSQPEPRRSRRWLPAGRVTIGLTAGASTPNRLLGEVIERIAALRGHTALPTTHAGHPA